MKNDHDYYRAYLPGEQDDREQRLPLRLRFVIWLGELLGVDKIIDRLFGDTVSPALTSSDGAFSCTPDHAVEVAYALNLAETIVHKGRMSCWSLSEVGEVLTSYLDGRTSIEEVIREFQSALDDLSDNETEDALRNLRDDLIPHGKGEL